MISETIRKEDPKRFNWFIRLVQGFLIGAFSFIPFSDQKALEETIRTDDFVRAKKGGISYKRRWSYSLGIFLGLFFFSLIPVEYLVTNFPFAIYVGLTLFSLGFIVYEFYLLFTAKEKNIIVSILLFLLGASIVIISYFYNFKDLTDFNSSRGYVLVFSLFAFGSLFASYSGISVGSFIYLSGTYITLSNKLRSLDYLIGIKDNFIFIALILIGTFIGTFLGFILKNQNNNKRIKASFNLGIYLPLLIFFIKDKAIGVNFYTEISTSHVAQLITNISITLAMLLISIVLTIHGYSFFNKEDNQSEYVTINHYTSNELKDILTDGIIENLDSAKDIKK